MLWWTAFVSLGSGVGLRNTERKVAILIRDLQMRMLWSECFKMEVLLLFRYGKANRSGDDCHCKGSLLALPDPKSRGHTGRTRSVRGQRE